MDKIILIVLLLVVAGVDIKKRIIPDSLCLCIAIIGLMNFQVINLLGIFCVIPFIMAGLKNRMGGGDIKLVMVMAFILGLEKSMVSIIAGLTIMLLFYLIQKMFKRRGKTPLLFRQLQIPLAPFLVAGYIAILIIS